MRMILPAALALAAPAAAQQAAPPATPASPPAAAPATVTPRPALPGAGRTPSIEGLGPVSKNAPVNGVLVLYGNERCPTNSDGDEVVVCTRRGAAEQFRVPKELRELQVTPENESWAAKGRATLDTGVGVNGIGTCSVVGSGGASGCFAQSVRADRAENKARRDEEARAP